MLSVGDKVRYRKKNADYLDGIYSHARDAGRIENHPEYGYIIRWPNGESTGLHWQEIEPANVWWRLKARIRDLPWRLYNAKVRLKMRLLAPYYWWQDRQREATQLKAWGLDKKKALGKLRATRPDGWETANGWGVVPPIPHCPRCGAPMQFRRQQVEKDGNPEAFIGFCGHEW